MSQSKDPLDAVREHIKKVNKQTTSQFSSLISKQNKLIQKAVQPALESQEIVKKNLNVIRSQQQTTRLFSANAFSKVELPKIELPDLSWIAEEVNRVNSLLEKQLAPIFEGLEARFRELPPQTQEALILLGSHGWYLDLEMPVSMIWKLKDTLAEGRVQEAESTLVEHFGNRVDDIENDLIQVVPTRQKIISAAFSAHKRQEYELSVPVLLSQTDGICKELIGEHLFMKDRKQGRNRPKTSLYVDQIAADTYLRALLSPLTQNLPISQSAVERDEGFTELNRHMVLHGESLDYGTEINSFKAISLINYVVHVLKTAEDRSLKSDLEESTKINLLFDRFA